MELITSLREYAESDGLPNAIDKADRWRYVLEEMFECCNLKQKNHIVAIMGPINILLAEWSQEPAHEYYPDSTTVIPV